MEQRDLKIYEQLKDKVFSQGCESQAFSMLLAIEEYLLSDFAYKHSLLRLFVRPLFYMGYESCEISFDFVDYYREHFIENEKDKFRHPNELCEFMKENTALLLKIMEELQLCCEYYDIEYSGEANAVIFRKQIFHNIEELRRYFIADFQQLDISDDEINRIFDEESKEFKSVFQEINAYETKGDRLWKVEKD